VVCLIVVHDDVIWCPETLWETHVKHVASECLGPWSLRTEVVPLSVIAPPPLDVVICTVHILHDLVPPPVSLTVRVCVALDASSDDSADHGPEPGPVSFDE
jgi:hypothetical protein